MAKIGRGRSAGMVLHAPRKRANDPASQRTAPTRVFREEYSILSDTNLFWCRSELNVMKGIIFQDEKQFVDREAVV